MENNVHMSLDVRSKVLTDFAENGPATGYQIAVRTKIPRSSVYKALGELRNGGWIENIKIESGPGPLGKKEYALTLPGRCKALSLFNSNQIDIYAEKWEEELPLVLGKWRFYCENGLRDQAISRIQSAFNKSGINKKNIQGIASSYQAQLFYGAHIDLHDSLLSDDDFRYFFTHMFHHLIPVAYRQAEYFNDKEIDEQDKWIDICMRDRELRECIKNVISRQKDEVKAEIYWQNKILESYEDILDRIKNNKKEVDVK